MWLITPLRFYYIVAFQREIKSYGTVLLQKNWEYFVFLKVMLETTASSETEKTTKQKFGLFYR